MQVNVNVVLLGIVVFCVTVIHIQGTEGSTLKQLKNFVQMVLIQQPCKKGYGT